MSYRLMPKKQSEKLKKRIADLEKQLFQTQEALNISQRRCEIAVAFSDVSLFDYNIKTKKILTQPGDFEHFGIPGFLENGVDELLDSGVIAQRSKADLRGLYQKIDAGALSASATIYANDLNGTERTLLLQMVNILDPNGKPTYAVGLRKDITDSLQFRKEKDYSSLLSSELTFIYEANVSQDLVLRYDPGWAKEVGLGDVKTLAKILQLMRQRHIAPEDAQMFVDKQSKASILAAFAHGERIITFEYRKWVVDEGYLWFEARINIVEDELNKDIHMRVYISNIDAKKKSTMQTLAERKRYELALSKSVDAYKINVTKQSINLLQEGLQDQIDAFSGEHALRPLLLIVLEATHPQQRIAMTTLLSPANLLENYTLGNTNLACDYQRLDKTKNYHWFRCSLQLFEDPETKDILGYVYIEDIHVEKEKELALLYKAQHDLMTGFYNKNVAAEKIDEILASEEEAAGIHIFFIIDLDHFKEVNDTFGHAFGDLVLAQTATRTSALFRNSDILGRIGGDEFIIFMKHVQDEEAALVKAQEICDAADHIYFENGRTLHVTVSVGIAIYDKHGKNFDQLYRHSDTALYHAKKQGRNRFSLYHQTPPPTAKRIVTT